MGRRRRSGAQIPVTRDEVGEVQRALLDLAEGLNRIPKANADEPGDTYLTVDQLRTLGFGRRQLETFVHHLAVADAIVSGSIDTAEED